MTICALCGKEVHGRANQKYCGKQIDKTSCAYQAHLVNIIAWKNKNRDRLAKKKGPYKDPTQFSAGQLKTRRYEDDDSWLVPQD